MTVLSNIDTIIDHVSAKELNWWTSKIRKKESHPVFIAMCILYHESTGVYTKEQLKQRLQDILDSHFV